MNVYWFVRPARLLCGRSSPIALCSMHVVIKRLLELDWKGGSSKCPLHK